MLSDLITSSSSDALKGTLCLPGDKSISHRALMLSAIAEGVSTIEHFLHSTDCLATLSALKNLGVHITEHEDTVQIEGVGLHGLKPPSQALDCGNAGTGMRLLLGLLCAQAFPSTLIGDSSLSQRPMQRVAKPLCQMGADIQLSEQGTAPIHIKPVKQLQAIEYSLPIASAQIKSALLIAGLYTCGVMRLSGAIRTRDHTEKMLQSFGCDITTSEQLIELHAGRRLRAQSIRVPVDISSAAFFIVAACLVPGSHVRLENVGMNPRRDGILRVLQRMGAQLNISNRRFFQAEPVADIEVRHARLKGIEVPVDWVPNAIDEFPVIMVAAACAQGTTILQDVEELRYKESDRIHAMAEGLKRCGINVEASRDRVVIQGGSLRGGEIDSFDDHRVAMAFLVAGLVAKETISVKGCRSIHTSFPDFFSLAEQAGFVLCQT